MTLMGSGEVHRVNCIPSTEHTALTAFSEGEAGRSPQPKKCEAGRMDEQFPFRTFAELTTLPEISWLVLAAQNLTVPPRCRQMIIGAMETDQDIPRLVCVEPAHIPIEVVFPARGLTRRGEVQ